MPLIPSVFSTEFQDRKFIPSPAAISHSHLPISVPAVTHPRDPRHFDSVGYRSLQVNAAHLRSGRICGGPGFRLSLCRVRVPHPCLVRVGVLTFLRQSAVSTHFPLDKKCLPAYSVEWVI